MATYTHTNPDSLVVGFRKFYKDEFDRHKSMWAMYYAEIENSTRAFEEHTGTTGLGLLSEISQGGRIIYDDTIPTFKTRFDHKKYGLGFQITEEAQEDDQYDLYGKRMSKQLAQSTAETIEIHGHLPWNRGHDSNFALSDGKPFFATDHPMREAPDQRNKPSVAADLSEPLIEQIIIDCAAWQNHRGIKINNRPFRVFVHPANEFLARRLFESQLLPSAGATSGHTNTFAPNDINPIKGRFEVVVDPYLLDEDAIYVQCSKHFGTWYWRKRPKFDRDNDFETTNLRMAVRGRWSNGIPNWQGWYSSPGAG